MITCRLTVNGWEIWNVWSFIFPLEMTDGRATADYLPKFIDFRHSQREKGTFLCPWTWGKRRKRKSRVAKIRRGKTTTPSADAAATQTSQDQQLEESVHSEPGKKKYTAKKILIKYVDIDSSKGPQDLFQALVVGKMLLAPNVAIHFKLNVIL